MSPARGLFPLRENLHTAYQDLPFDPSVRLRATSRGWRILHSRCALLATVQDRTRRHNRAYDLEGSRPSFSCSRSVRIESYAEAQRILTLSSNAHDVVLDAFCGCGTAIVAAERLKRQWIGIDVSPTACRVMAKRLRDVCHLKEGQQAWLAGKGFIVEGLPWSEAHLRKLPPFEFENWAVIALGGIPNKTQVGDMGIDGRIFPVSTTPEKRGKATGHLDFMDDWYPVQVKQKDKAGRPDIDAFEAKASPSRRRPPPRACHGFGSDPASSGVYQVTTTGDGGCARSAYPRKLQCL